MLRGRIDLLVRERDSVVIVDYKTDRVTADQLEARKDSYRPQVHLYRDAIKKLTGLEVATVYLIFLAPRLLCPM